MKDKQLKWIIIGLLGGGGGFQAKNLIEQLWAPHKLENQRRMEEAQLTRHELERLNYNTLVIQHLLSGMTLDKAIETANEE